AFSRAPARLPFRVRGRPCSIGSTGESNARRKTTVARVIDPHSRSRVQLTASHCSTAANPLQSTLCLREILTIVMPAAATTSPDAALSARCRLDPQAAAVELTDVSFAYDV